MYNPFQSFEEGEGRTKPLEDFKYLLPGPGPSELLNESLIDKFGRDDSKELERLEAIDKKAPIRQKRQLTAEAVGREVSKSKYARKFFKGMEGSALNSVAGIARMTGKDEFADNLQAYMQDPISDKRMAKLLTMAEDTSDFQADRLKDELEENFGTQLAEGAGQLTGQIALTTSASAVGGPKAGMFALVGQVVGQNYEGNYQRAKQELIEKEFTNKLPETDEEMQAVMDKASDDAKEIAFKNLPSAVPEVILDRLFLKGLGKTLRNQAGTVTDKLVGTTVGALAEGGSEALSSSLQNFMVQRNIDPSQPLTEGVLRDFALGTLLGGGANLTTGAVGAGEQVLSSDIQAFRNDLIKRLKKDAKAGDQRAQDFLDRFSNMMETQVADGDIIASASTQGTGNGMSAKEVQSIVDEVSGKSGVNTIVVNNLDEVKNIDPSLAPSLEGQEGVEGFYTSAGGDQRVFLNASELNGREDVERVLRHEAVGHLGTEMVSGQMSDAFYTMIGEKYFDSDLGKRIANDYALDPLYDMNTLGKEIVARVSENPDNASPGFKATIIDTFHKLTGGRIEQNPETDRLITKSITLAEQVLASPKIRTKLEAQAKDARVEDEDDIDTVLYRRGDPDHGVLGTVEDGEIKYTKSGDLAFMDHTEPIGVARRGNSFRFNEASKTAYYWESKPSDIDRDAVEIMLEKKGYDISGIKHKHLDANSPNFKAMYEDAHTMPLRGEKGVNYSKKARAGYDYAQMLASLEMDRPQFERDLDILQSQADEAYEMSPDENSQATQRKNTLPTYIKAKAFLDSMQEGGKTLDYGAGLGYGSVAMGADSYEPFARDDFVTGFDEDLNPTSVGKPTYSKSNEIESDSYDKLVTTNVLNVVKNVAGERDMVVRDIGRVLSPGGRAVIQTRDVNAVMSAKTAEPTGLEPNSVYALSEGKRTYQKGFDKAELQEYVSGILGDGFNVSLVPASEKISGSAVVVEKDADYMNAVKQANQQVLFSKKSQELRGGMTRDKNGNIFYKGQPPNEWGPETFEEVGKLYGIKRFGGLSPLKEIKDPETGKTYKIPGGLDGKFTYYDMLWLKSNQPGIQNIGEATHAKITKKLSQSLTPEKVDKVDHFNRLAFGFLSPNAPLLPNEYGVARLFASSEADIAKLAKLAESLPANPRKRGAWNKKVKAQFDIGSRADGQLGIGLTQDFGRLANFARLYQKNPDFFIKKADEEWSDFVDKVASQVSGFGTKTASFGGVWQDPFNAMISAIDRHMATKFADEVIRDPALKKRFQKLMVGKFNKEIDKSREARAKYQAKLKKAKTEKTKLKIQQDWEDDQENILDPSIRKVKTLDGVMKQAERVGSEQISKALGKATLAGMSARNPQFRNAKGEINPNLEGEIALTKFIEEPEKVKIMSDAYRKALDINEKKAEELGIPVFPAQWTLWDRIRGRIEPHEVMFPGLSKLPRMGREQIAQTYNTHIASGYGIAPLEIKPTNLPPERLVYFSKKPGSTPDPITGESKFIVRLQADETLPSQLRENLDSLYTVEAHQDVLDSLKPWFESMKDKDYIEISRAIQSTARNDLNSTQKMLAGQIMLKRLSAKAESLRKKMDKKDSTGQMKFDGIVDTNKFDDEAIDLATWMSEQGRAMGRAISILQVFGQLNPRAMFKLAKGQLNKATDHKLRKELGEGGERIVSELDRIIKVAQQAGYDQIGIEFLKKKAPSLIKAIEKQFAPSLWGAYRKDAVGKLHKQIMQAMSPTSESPGSAPLARFTNELVSELAKRMNLEAGTGQRKLRAKSDILRDALLNPEKYRQVWRDLALKLKQDKTLSDEQKAKIEDLFGTIPTDPSGKILDSTMQERMKRFGVQIQELVRQSPDIKRTTGKKLVDSIVDEMGLPPQLATKLAIQLQSTYQKRIREVTNSQLETFKKQQLGEKASRKIKGLEQTVVELANLGALTRQDLTEAVAKKLGIKGTFNRKFANELQRLALQIEKTPEGFQRINKVQDVLNLIQNQAGDSLSALLLAIRTAGLVSGVSTQVVNLTGNTATAVPMFMTQVMRSGFSPQTSYLMARNMLFGLVKGSQEAKSIMLTGRGRTGYEMEKYSFDPILERKTLPGGKINPYNYLKYVHRFMSSMDAMFRFTNIEGKATFLLAMEGKKKGYRGKRLRQYIDEGLGNTEALREGAEAQATLEGLSGLDHRRRTNEILESNRNPDIKEESEQYGLRSTYQNRPEGILGAVASKFAQASYPQQLPGQQVPLSQQALAVTSQFFVPFIRVVANVQNMAFDYTPVVGAGRAVWHKYGGAQVKAGGKNITEEQYQDLMARQLIGLAMAGSLGALFFNEEEDENNRMFDVTGAGPRNYQKRKTLAESGWKPYTVTWMGKQLGYKETPFGGFLAFMGGIKDMKKYEDDQYTMGNIISAGTVAYGRLMFDQAFFKGIGDLINVLSFDEQSGDRFTRLLFSSPGQVAVPNLFNQIEAMLTNEKYTKGEGESALLHEILPFSPARALGLPNRDVFGQRVQRYNEEFPMNLVARVYDSDRKDPLLQELIAKKIIPVSPKRGVSIRGEELDDALSDLHRDQDIYVYSEIKGRHLKNKLQELFEKDRDGQTGLERFRGMSREDAQDFYNQVNSYASDIAKRETSRMTRLEIVERIKKLKAE